MKKMNQNESKLSLLKRKILYENFQVHFSASILFVVTLVIMFITGCKLNEIENNVPDEPIEGVPQLKSAYADFSIVVLPDPQYYTSPTNGGTAAMFTAQMNWIINNRSSENIAYVCCVGDISDHADSGTTEWTNATTNGLYMLEPYDIPYGVAVGNHDQSPNTGYPLTCTTNKFNTYFGVSHFSGRSYYGGHYGSNNDSHYDLFSGGGLNWIVIYVEYDSHNQDGTAMNNWVDGLLGTYSSRKAIIVTHQAIGNAAARVQAPWYAESDGYYQGKVLYDRIKARRNVAMMFCGHTGTEGYRMDTYGGRTMKTFLADYQFWTNGGNGLMRIMNISRDNDLISVKTYSPYLNQWFTSETNQFTKPLFHEPTTTRTCDFDNDGISELSFFNNGIWKVEGMSNVSYGTTGDIPVPADYDGDGKTDFAVCRLQADNNIRWFRNVTGVSDANLGLVSENDVPVPADYDADGIADIAVWRPGNGKWYVISSTTGNMTSTVYGQSGDIPVPADYNGDGKVELAVYRPSNYTWYILGVESWAYGAAGVIPVLGDYNADGTVARSFFKPSNGGWYLEKSTSALVYGQSGDIPAPGDYDGDGKTDKAYYRSGTLYISPSGGGSAFTVTLGNIGAGDKLLNLPYAVRKVFFP